MSYDHWAFYDETLEAVWRSQQPNSYYLTRKKRWSLLPGADKVTVPLREAEFEARHKALGSPKPVVGIGNTSRVWSVYEAR